MVGGSWCISECFRLRLPVVYFRGCHVVRSVFSAQPHRTFTPSATPSASALRDGPARVCEGAHRASQNESQKASWLLKYGHFATLWAEGSFGMFWVLRGCRAHFWRDVYFLVLLYPSPEAENGRAKSQRANSTARHRSAGANRGGTPSTVPADTPNRAGARRATAAAVVSAIFDRSSPAPRGTGRCCLRCSGVCSQLGSRMISAHILQIVTGALGCASEREFLKEMLSFCARLSDSVDGLRTRDVHFHFSRLV